MTLKDILKKKEKIKEDVTPSVVSPPEPDPIADGFTFVRSDTNTQELISPPSFTSEVAEPAPHKSEHRLSSHFSRLRSSSNASTQSAQSRTSPKSEKRLSQRLHLNRSRTPSSSSVNVPTDLPHIQDVAVQGEEKEAQWEERATMLAKGNPNNRPASLNGQPKGVTCEQKFYQDRFPQETPTDPEQSLSVRPGTTRSVSSAKGDENIQEAIRLHESGELVNSTAMFGRLADSNAMAQIMFGLALRHGWGVPPNPPLAIQHLSAAASSSASVESAALHSGMKKGGAAKGELVLAIYELANSFRHGWGVQKDVVAARKYYETAANLGDTDAMNEVARCYESGQGGPKDRVSPDFLFIPQTRTLEKSKVWREHFVLPLIAQVDLESPSHSHCCLAACLTGCEKSGCDPSNISPKPAAHLNQADLRSFIDYLSSRPILPLNSIASHHITLHHIRHQRILLIPSSIQQRNITVSPNRTDPKPSETVGKPFFPIVQPIIFRVFLLGWQFIPFEIYYFRRASLATIVRAAG